MSDFKKLGQSFNKWAYKVRRKVFDREVSRLPVNLAKTNVLGVGSGTGFTYKLGMGHLLGSMRCPVEMLMVNLAAKSPTTEFVILKKN